jgi:hypothetical protein
MGTLQSKLDEEMKQWKKKTYPELVSMKYPHTYTRGVEGDPDRYDVEVDLLERNAEYIHLGISVSSKGFSSFVPKSSSIIAYARKPAGDSGSGG